MPSELSSYPREEIHWGDAVRIQPWRHPEAEIWKRLTETPDLDALLVLLQHTEPGAFTALGRIDRLEGWQIMHGDGAGWAMPAYTLGGPGRFNTERFGCFYAAEHLETAVAETAYHQARLLREARFGPRELRMRALRAEVEGTMLSLLGLSPEHPVYDPEHYHASRAIGVEAHRTGVDGILYTSVRRPRFACLALFQPSRIVRCTSAEALAYLWDGTRIRVEHRIPLDW